MGGGRLLTRGEARLLVTLGELDVEVGHQGVDVVVALDLQAEGRGEGQVLRLHRVDVHFLGRGERAAASRPPACTRVHV